jgi:hypothetical protein
MRGVTIATPLLPAVSGGVEQIILFLFSKTYAGHDPLDV